MTIINMDQFLVELALALGTKRIILLHSMDDGQFKVDMISPTSMKPAELCRDGIMALQEVINQLDHGQVKEQQIRTE